MKLAKTLITFFISFGLVVLFNYKLGDIPPLGRFFDPFHGCWQNALANDIQDQRISITRLQNNISVVYDDQEIPHVFATNDYDLYFAQGYVTAKDRLWQMDFQTRYASGRLSEVIGEKALQVDRYQRRMGMLYGAEKMLEESNKDPISRSILQAYTDGVNAYIRSLSPKDYPLEFKILDYAPEPWKPLNTALLLKLMSATLAGGSDELFMSRILSTYGEEITTNLFPSHPLRNDPIIPRGTPWRFSPLVIPSSKKQTVSNDSIQSSASTKKSKNLAISSNNLLTGIKEENLGSNNWAISGNKSTSGLPLLANDPHLNITLPSIWYQIQLHGPHGNTYGVSIPGAPCIIIGFNAHIAWGVTNVGSDVLDWYKIKFRGPRHEAYRYGGKWLPTSMRIEEIKIRGKKPLSDTVYYTIHGPVTYLGDKQTTDFPLTDNIPQNAALKWVAHLPSNDLRTFYELNRAQTYTDYKMALTFFSAPAQNFVYADNQNNIAITSNGYFPLKRYEQGKFILDGSNPDDDWHGRIPAAQNPTVTNPKRGFVSSANQSPTDESYPYYLDWQFAPYDRAHRINQLLTGMRKASIDSLRLMQMDDHSVLADEILDTLIQVTQRNKRLSAEQRSALDTLINWDHAYHANSIAATLFEKWFNAIDDALWHNHFSTPDHKMRYPSLDRTVSLILNEPLSLWFSKDLSPNQDARTELFKEALTTTYQRLKDKYGPIGSAWQWGLVKGTHVPHLAGMPGLGSEKLITGGSKKTINALSEKNGPSWRMVVQLGKKPKAYGILPGGSSGNPGSHYYDNQLEEWTNGELIELLYLDHPDQKNNRIKHRLVLEKE